MHQAEKNKEQELQAIGKNFKRLRLELSKRLGLHGEEFYSQVNIPAATYKAYETGEKFPGFEEIQNLGLQTGVNLNWLVYDNGSMFGAREKDMEEMIAYIEANETGRYNDYKLLLKLLRVPKVENFFFQLQDLALNFLYEEKNPASQEIKKK